MSSVPCVGDSVLLKTRIKTYLALMGIYRMAQNFDGGKLQFIKILPFKVFFPIAVCM